MPMRVFRVTADGDVYRYFLIQSEDLLLSPGVDFDGRSHASTWRPVEVWIERPRLKKGDFLDCLTGCMGG
jgi:hypothetical protein